MFEKKFKTRMNQISHQTKPSLLFRVKMEYRLFKKGMGVFIHSSGAKFRIVTAGSMVFLVFGSSVGVYAYSSPEVTPENMLYPVKQGIERVEVGFAFSPEAKAQAHLKMALRRLDENDSLRKRINEKKINEELVRAALEQTLAQAGMDMNNSIMVIKNVPVSEPSAQFVGNFEVKFAKINERISHCRNLHSKKLRNAMTNKMNVVRSNAQQNFQKIRHARMRMIEIINNGNGKRVFIKDIME